MTIRRALWVSTVLTICAAASAGSAEASSSRRAVSPLHPAAPRTERTSSVGVDYLLHDIDFGGLRWSVVRLHVDGAERLSAMTMSLRGETLEHVQSMVADMLSSPSPSQLERLMASDDMQVRVCEESDASITVSLERRADLA